jgi:hypothetical protein
VKIPIKNVIKFEKSKEEICCHWRDKCIHITTAPTPSSWPLTSRGEQILQSLIVGIDWMIGELQATTLN